MAAIAARDAGAAGSRMREHFGNGLAAAEGG